MTGANWFLVGFLFIGLPMIAPTALGVLLGRQLLGPPGAKHRPRGEQAKLT
jgi:hypothetical protein